MSWPMRWPPLPAATRDVVVLRLRGFTLRAIAVELDVPLGTVKWRLHQAIGRLGHNCLPP